MDLARARPSEMLRFRGAALVVVVGALASCHAATAPPPKRRVEPPELDREMVGARCPEQGIPACPGLCGNGVRDDCPGLFDARCASKGEECEGDDLGGKSCRDFGFAGGTLRCGEGCSLDAESCTP